MPEGVVYVALPLVSPWCEYLHVGGVGGGGRGKIYVYGEGVGKQSERAGSRVIQSDSV